jgi:D-alanyl-D-alanine carboxypeptidase
MPDPEIFEAFLKNHPRLAQAMKKADAYFSAKGKKQWQTNEDRKTARRERMVKERGVVDGLKQKMDKQVGSCLMMATAEEAELLTSRRWLG